MFTNPTNLRFGMGPLGSTCKKREMKRMPNPKRRNMPASCSGLGKTIWTYWAFAILDAALRMGTGTQPAFLILMY